jgi:hypothetical protein
MPSDDYAHDVVKEGRRRKTGEEGKGGRGESVAVSAVNRVRGMKMMAIRSISTT